MANSTTPKPSKPHPDFPLFPHATRRWAKKIKGRLHYFGPWDDPQGALERYLAVKDDLLAGRTPRPKTEGLSLRDLCNKFLTTKHLLVADGELSPRTFDGYFKACARLLEVFGKNRLVTDLEIGDFEQLQAVLSKTLNHTSRGAEIGRIKVVLHYAFNEGLIDRPIRFGGAFRAPPRRTVQTELHAQKEARKPTAGEIRRMIDGANVQLRAMILLGINCGFGNTDCATLTFKTLDLEGGWVTGPRHKTGVMRRAKLWPETVAALRAAISERRTPAAAGDADLVFLTQTGRSWVRMEKPGWTDAVSNVSHVLMRKLGINAGASFYSLRRMTETIGGGCKDQVAVDHVMGHSRGDMASVTGSTSTMPDWWPWPTRSAPGFSEPRRKSKLNTAGARLRGPKPGFRPDAPANLSSEPLSEVESMDAEKKLEIIQRFLGPDRICRIVEQGSTGSPESRAGNAADAELIAGPAIDAATNANVVLRGPGIPSEQKGNLPPMSETETNLYNYIRDNGPKTQKEIEMHFGVQPKTYDRVLKALRSRGLCNRRGVGYYLKSPRGNA